MTNENTAYIPKRKNPKKAFLLLIGIFVAILIVFIVLNFVIPSNDDELDNVTIDFKKLELNTAIVKQPVSNTSDKWYVGTWVMPDESMGGITFDIDETKDKQVKVTFNDFSYGGGVGRGATFETEPFKMYEEIKDKLYYGRFYWESANAGFGYIYANQNELTLILQSTKGGGGLINKIYDGSYTFQRPSLPKTISALQAIDKKIKMYEKGYIPNDNVTYVYMSVDGDSTSKNIFNTKKQTFERVINWENEKKYEVSKKSFFILNTYTDNELKKEKVEKVEVLRFKMKKGTKWESDDTTYEVIDDNYPLIKGLDGIMVIKETYKKESSFNYYHKKFGLIGYGIKSKNKYGHKPLYLLDGIEID